MTPTCGRVQAPGDCPAHPLGTITRQIFFQRGRGTGVLFPSSSHHAPPHGWEQETSALAHFLSFPTLYHASCTFLVNKNRSNTEYQGKASRSHLVHFQLAGAVVGLGTSWWPHGHLSQELWQHSESPQESHLACLLKEGMEILCEGAWVKPEVVVSFRSVLPFGQMSQSPEPQYCELYKYIRLFLRITQEP